MEEKRKKKLVASSLIESNSKRYCEEIITNLFPSPIDGLIVSQRRIIQTQNPKGNIPSNKLIGDTFELHNHNDKSIYDTATKLCDEFRNPIPLLNIKGSGNSYFNEDASAARYTEFVVSEGCKDLFLRGTNNKTLPRKLSVDLTGTELVHYIPKIPTALIFPNKSIGYGFSTLSVSLGIHEVCDLVMYYVKNKNDFGECNFSRLIKKFLPKLPIRCNICNIPELIYQYRRKNFRAPIMTEGEYKLNGNNTILIRTIAYGESPTTGYSNFITQMGIPSSWIAKHDLRVFATSTDINYADIEIVITKKVSNIFEIADKLKKFLKIRRAVHPAPNYAIDSMMVPLDYSQIISLWYIERKNSVRNDKKYRQQELFSAISETEVYILVCDRKDTVMAIIESSTSKEIAMTKLKEAFDLTLRQCEILTQVSLITFSAYKKKELVEKLQKLRDDMKELVKSFNRIDEKILDEVKKVKKKYSNSADHSSFEYKWKGCVQIHNQGFALYESMDRAFELANMFKNKRLSLVDFAGADRISIFDGGRNVITASHLSALSPTHQGDTIHLEKKGKRCTYFTGTKWTDKADPTFQRFHLGTDLYGVSMKKGIHEVNFDEATEYRRKVLVKYMFDKTADQEFWVISVCSANWGEFIIQTVKVGQKLVPALGGTEYIIAVVPVGTDSVIVNVPMHPKHNVIIFNRLKKRTKTKLERINIRSLKQRM